MAAPVGERRVVSVLLADIADSTAIGEKLGTERSKFLFDEVARLLVGEVKRFGGTVSRGSSPLAQVTPALIANTPAGS